MSFPKNNSTEKKAQIAYFSMEIGISHELPTYAGGLGVLAGDLLKSYADLNIPFVGVTLLNEKGYFRQSIDDSGKQIESDLSWPIRKYMKLMPHKVTVSIAGRPVIVRAWKHLINGQAGNRSPIFFLDTNCSENSDADKKLTSHLYGGDRQYRLAQEIVLGVGGLRMLKALGYYDIQKYHLNEGHAALLAIELLHGLSSDKEQEEKTIATVKDRCVFTTHTPVAAGHDQFTQTLWRKLLGDFVPPSIYKKIITPEKKVSMTLLALTMSTYINGVAKQHARVTREMFPSYHINSITNGVHPPSWTSPAWSDLFDKNLSGWRLDPHILRNALIINNQAVWRAHQLSKQALLKEIEKSCGQKYDQNTFTLGFARRFTAYKRPDLLFFDLERLKNIAARHGGLQLVFAGKAHAQDRQGKKLINNINKLALQLRQEQGLLRLVFLPQYDMRLAKLMVSGSDAWLNTPQLPYEASGTSGMKAALNGVPHFSTIDGWWLEGLLEGLTGWGIGAHPQDKNISFAGDIDPEPDANSLYKKLDAVILPLFYKNNSAWINIMKHCIAINGSFFNTYRMAQQYLTNAYLAQSDE
ncbi:MAG: alpha-glucan family phosphorylase [Candidatus Komeilibacteria bacterium]